jgi:hypothetical protein
MGPEEAGLWLKKKTWEGYPLRFVIDASFKPLLPPSCISMSLLRVTLFDGISLRKLDMEDDWRTGITVKGMGRLSQKGVRSIAPVAGQGAEVGMRAVGLGAGVHMVRFAEELFKRNGLIQHNDTNEHRSTLRFEGNDFGRADYLGRAYYSLKRPTAIVRRIVPKADISSLIRRPVLTSRAEITLDLTNVVPKGNGYIEVSTREYTDATKLSRDHARPVVLTTWYEADARSLDEAGREIGARIYCGRLSKRFGPIRYEPIEGVTKSRET